MISEIVRRENFDRITIGTGFKRDAMAKLRQEVEHSRKQNPFDPKNYRPAEDLSGLQIKGPLSFRNGSWYKGQMKDSKKHGLGECIMTDNSYYHGYWSEDKPHGYGQIIDPNGECYIGEWEQGMRHGTGTYYYKDGSKYVGTWQHDLREGKGRLVLKDQAFFEVEFHYDQYHGMCKLPLVGGCGVYQGNFEQGRQHGSGTLIYRDKKYKQNYENGEMQGYNEVPYFTHHQGYEYYEGNLEAGKRSGNGKLKLKNGWTYDGEWKDDKRNGEGMETYGTSGFYGGFFENDRRKGSGCYTFSNGSKFVGEFDNYPVGPGEFIDLVRGRNFKGEAIVQYKFRVDETGEIINMM